MQVSLRLLLLVLLATTGTAGASPLFDDNSVLEVELEGPLYSLFRNKRDENREEMPFGMTAEGTRHEINARIRGKSRLEYCIFPPLRLNFKKDSVAGTLFAGQDKLKLVTHCSQSKFAEANILEEFAAYKILNVLTEKSFRVRLVHIHYIDTDDHVNGLESPRYGFLIEAKEQMAERTGGGFPDKPRVSVKQLDQEHAVLVYVFQYLIGNTDWSLATATGEEICCHNVALLESESLLNPVPFDFDLSGLVNARYAKPHPGLRSIIRVTQRLYRGHCTDPVTLRNTISFIKSKREDIVDIINDLPMLTLKNKQQKIDFLERAFKAMEKEDKLIRSFEDHCLG